MVLGKFVWFKLVQVPGEAVQQEVEFHAGTSPDIRAFTE